MRRAIFWISSGLFFLYLVHLQALSSDISSGSAKAASSYEKINNSGLRVHITSGENTAFTEDYTADQQSNILEENPLLSGTEGIPDISPFSGEDNISLLLALSGGTLGGSSGNTVQSGQQEVLSTGNQTTGSISEIPQLVITEAFFHKTNSWIEITNISPYAYSGEIVLHGISKHQLPFSYQIYIPASTSLVLAKNNTYFTGNFHKKITKDAYFINWKTGITITLTYGSGQEDLLTVHPEWTRFLKDKDCSFEKVFLNGQRLTTRTTPDRIKNMKLWIVNGNSQSLIANPGLYFTEAENAKDISQPKTTIPQSPEDPYTLPISCDNFIDRFRLEVQEIFFGNSSYDPFIELKRTDTPGEYQELRFTGNLIHQSFSLEKSDLWEKHQTFIIAKNEFWYSKGIDSEIHSDFFLQHQTGYLIIEGFNGHIRQVLDTIIVPHITSGNSVYFGGEKHHCFPIFNQTGSFSPGFHNKFLEFFQIDTQPKIEYITIGGGGGGCNCPGKEDLCPDTAKTPKIDTGSTASDFPSFSTDDYEIRIEDINHIPLGDAPQSITFLLVKGEKVDLSLLTLTVNGKKKKLTGELTKGNSYTLTGNFSFPKTSSKIVTVQLLYNNQVIDTYHYLPSQKSPKKEFLKKEGIKVFSVLDGDTIRYKDEEGKLQSIRLLGVDAPESNTARYKKTECYGQEAKHYLKERLKGQYIQLTFDSNSPHTDRYGRLLAYVRLDNQLINQELIQKGYAKEYTYKQTYEQQEAFRQAEQEAQNSGIGMRDIQYCPNQLPYEKERKENSKHLIMKIIGIDYAPREKQPESITLSLFDKSQTLKTIDFSNHFGLIILDQNLSGSFLSPAELIELGTFKDLEFLGVQTLHSPLVLTGNFELPNKKSSCIALVQKDHLFDIACYEVPGVQPIFTGNGPLHDISIKIHSLTPNPKGKDTDQESFSLSFTSEHEAIQELSLHSGFYLLINEKKKKYLSGTLLLGEVHTFTGNFGFPNKDSCIAIGKEHQIFDTFCYRKPQEGKTYTITQPFPSKTPTEEDIFLKNLKLVKKENTYCVKYNNQILSGLCKPLPKVKTSQEKSWKQKSQAREYAFGGLVNLLYTHYRPRYEETIVSDYINLVKKMKSDLKNNTFSTVINTKTFNWKDIKLIFENQQQQTFIDSIVQKWIDPKLLQQYQQKKTERISQLPDTF